MSTRQLWDRLWPLRQFIFVILLFVINLIFYQPYWNFPSTANVFSAPLVPLLVRLSETLFAWDHQLAVSHVLTFFILIGPLAWYSFFRYLIPTGWTAPLAALLTSLPLSWWGITRTEAAYLWGDGAHLAALSFSPIACFFLIAFLRHGAFSRAVIAALGLALVALTSPFGLLTTLIFCLVVIFSEMLLGQARLKLARAGFVVLASLGLTSFWYHPRFFYQIITSHQGQELLETLGNLFPLSFFVVPILATLGFLLFERRRRLQPLFISLFFTLIFFWVSFANTLAETGLSRPSRYLPELGFSLALLIPVAGLKLNRQIINLAWLKAKIPSAQVRRLLRLGVIAILALLVIVFTIKNTINIYQNVQYSSIMGGWSDSERTGIWELKNPAGFWSWIGNLLTLSTIFLLFYLARLSKPQKSATHHESPLLSSK